MPDSQSHDIVLRLNRIDDLWNAPDIDPFSDNPVDVLGEPALQNLANRLRSRRIRDWSQFRLVLHLPADQISPDLPAQVKSAIARLGRARIDNNKLQIRNDLITNAIELVIIMLVLSVLAAFGWFVIKPLLQPVTDEMAQGLIVGAASLIVWVVMWDPIEALAFDWIDPAQENRMTRKIMEMPIVIAPSEPPTNAAV